MEPTLSGWVIGVGVAAGILGAIAVMILIPFIIFAVTWPFVWLHEGFNAPRAGGQR